MTGRSLRGTIPDFESRRRGNGCAPDSRPRHALRTRLGRYVRSSAPRICPANQSAAAAYSDHALPIGDGQTISQPYVVAAMTQALSLTGTERVLEIGGGSRISGGGPFAACPRSDRVELLPHWPALPANVWHGSATPMCRSKQGDGSLGWPAGAPYDAILVAAAAPAIPPPLLEQFAEGGRLVIPVGGADRAESVARRETRHSGFTQETLCACRFVPLRGRLAGQPTLPEAVQGSAAR